MPNSIEGIQHQSVDGLFRAVRRWLAAAVVVVVARRSPATT